jgi:glycosyltransferase involved in cell wall biosynthesis
MEIMGKKGLESFEWIKKVTELEGKYQDYELPKVSIILPVYNSVQTILSTLESLLKQEYPSYEIIVIDGGSTDRTLETINRYHDIKMHIFSTTSNHFYEMINKGIAEASGSYLNILYPGDFYLFPGALKYIMSLALEQENPHLIYCATLLRDGRSEPKILSRQLSLKLLKSGRMPTSLQSCWFRTDLFNDLGKFSPSYTSRSEYEFLCRFCLKKHFRVFSTSRVLVDYDFRILTRKTVLDHFWKTLKIIYQYFGIVPSLHWIIYQKDWLRFLKLWARSIKVAFLGRS